MRRWLAVAVAVGVIFIELLNAVPASGAGYPFNAYIAKSKHGKYKSSLVSGSCPKPIGGSCSNTQIQKATLAPGASKTFFVKVKNKGDGDFGFYLGASDDQNGFTVQYTEGVDDITGDIAGDCTFTPSIPSGGKIVILMKITNSSATTGTTKFFGIGDTGNFGCSSPEELVFAQVTAG